MGSSLKPQHLNRYRQIGGLLVKYGRSDLVKETGLEETLTAEEGTTPKETAKADELAADLEKLGPTFVKLGQLLSTRVELLPRAYLDALSRLQDEVEPFGFGEVAKIVTSEIGIRISKAFREQLKDFPHIIVPAPIADYSTPRVLTMEYVPGTKITEISPLARMEFDGEMLAEELFRAYLNQILVEGFFHADPHPGNVFLTPDHRIALLDLGMVGRIMPRLQEDLLQLLLAISEGHGEDASQIAIKIGQPRREFDQTEFSRRISEIVGQQKTATVEQMQVGRLVLEVTRCAAESQIRVPPELTMLGKTLLNLDQVGRTLAPQFDPI